MALQVLDGYPQSFGAKPVSVANIPGPTSYTTGGFSVDPASFGFKGIDIILIGTSASGTYDGEGRINNTGKTPGLLGTCKIVVSTVSTGAEVSNGTNLSAEQFRAFAISV